MTKLVAYLFLLTAVVGLQVLTMVYGWGLEVRSWGWIVGAGIVGQLVVRCLQIAIEQEN